MGKRPVAPTAALVVAWCNEKASAVLAKKDKHMTNKIHINGISFSGGKNITISNGRVVIDGVDRTPDAKEIRIEVQGDVQSIDADVCTSISVTGNSGAIKTQSGNIRCGDVHGSVKTMSGDVVCDAVTGGVKTMSGDITAK